jgi:outer membrane protein TolC
MLLSASGVHAQSTQPSPFTLVHAEAPAGPPVTITLQDALQRARQIDLQVLTSETDATLAYEERLQARSARMPAFSYTTQYLGNQASPKLLTGRFVSLDGVNMYRAWAVMRQELSPSVLTATSLHKAQATELVAQAKLEIAQRGLVVTVTREYYGLIVAQRKYATAQEAAMQAARFLEIARQQQRAGQVAQADVIKAEIQSGQQQVAFGEATLGMENARLALAVLLFPTLNENFTVVDDLNTPAALPPFAELRTMAGRNNPDILAADQALQAALQDVRAARSAFLPSVAVEGVYGIEANEFALHSRVSAQPDLGVLPNLGYFVTLNLTVPVWDWGGLQSKLRQSKTRTHQAEVDLRQAQRQLMRNLYQKYNEATVAKSAVDSLQQIAQLATESLRLINLRYQAGEATALEVVDAQNTLVQTRNAFDEAEARYRVALADLQTVTGSF